MNCNASSFAAAARVLTRTVAHGFFAIAMLADSSVGAESVAEFDDVAARMQYAFFTADVRALEDVLSLVEGFEPDPTHEVTKSYHLAYGHWKLAELYAEGASSERASRNTGSLAAKAARACSEHARAASAKDTRMAEVYAIQAACEAMPQGFLRLESLRSGSCARSRPLRTALSLAPQNPRVLFVEALCAGEQGEPADLARWRKVVDAFATPAPARPGIPDWGHAEALALLAECHLQRRDLVGARDATERALVLAPDYVTAKALLQTIASQRSN